MTTPPQLPDYLPENYKKISVAKDGDCGYHSLIHGLVLIKKKDKNFDLKFLNGIRESTSKPITYHTKWIEKIKNYLNKGSGHWLNEDDFRKITDLWNVCLVTYDRTQGSWKYFKPFKIWPTLESFKGCEKIIIFHHKLTHQDRKMDDYGTGVSGSADHWSLLIPKFEWKPYEITDIDEKIHYRSGLYRKFTELRNKISVVQYEKLLLKIIRTFGLVIPQEVGTPPGDEQRRRDFEQQRRDFEMFFVGELPVPKQKKSVNPSPPKPARKSPINCVPDAKNLYDRLGVPKNAPLDVIRKNFRRCIKSFHPDKNRLNEKAATIATQQLIEAWKMLENSRDLYDAQVEFETYKPPYSGDSQTHKGSRDNSDDSESDHWVYDQDYDYDYDEDYDEEE